MEQELLHELAAAYALDALDDSERQQFEEHLEGCEQCRDELEGLRDASAALAYVPEGTAPPPALRERVLQRVHEDRQANVVPLRRRVALPAVATFAVVAAAAAIVLAVWASSLSSSLDRKSAIARVLGDPTAARMSMGRSSQIVVGPNGEAVVVSKLDRAPAGKTYELWVIDRSGARAAGLFPAGSSSPILVARRVPKGSQVGVSIEPSGGSEHPTTIVGVSAPA